MDDRARNITPILVEYSVFRTAPIEFVAMPGPGDATMIIVGWPSGRIIGNPEMGIASQVISG
ncbi:MAG: hypothetical protein DMG76_33845 [Acidobacteria bacterium]|nr:MAG: hypothetical protein DMG76_33845 [Acidobacteriota bacterium]